MNYIYVLKDPETSRVMYVGVTNNPLKRFAEHMACSTGMKTISWINKLEKQGKTPHMDVIDFVEDRKTAEDVEKRLIEMFRYVGMKSRYAICNRGRHYQDFSVTINTMWCDECEIYLTDNGVLGTGYIEYVYLLTGNGTPVCDKCGNPHLSDRAKEMDWTEYWSYPRDKHDNELDRYAPPYIPK